MGNKKNCITRNLKIKYKRRLQRIKCSTKNDSSSPDEHSLQQELNQMANCEETGHSLHGSCEGVLGSSANDNCERAGNLNESEAGPVAEELMMEVAATNIIRLEHPEDDLETLIVKEEVSDDDEVNETDNIGVPSGAGFDAVEDTMNKEPYEVTLHDPTTACGDVIKTEPEDDGYPVPPERNEVSIAKAIIKIEPDDDKSSGSSSVEHGTGVHIEKIDFTEEEFK